jgi:cobalt-zinc-cadmium efflux system protein
MSSGHAHDHAHAHSLGHANEEFDRAFVLGIALNTAYVAVEAFYGWKFNSLALLADAGHNLSDVAGLVLAWGGALAGRVQPDARYTYGFKRASILAAFANSLLLLVAVGSLTWEAIGRLRAPEPAQGLAIMLVAAAGIGVNGATALLFRRGARSDLNVRGAFVHMAADALVSLGVVLAGALVLAFGWNWLDPLASLLIAAVILAGTWSLLRQSLRLLFDGVPEHIDLQAVHAYLAALPGVERVHDLHVWGMGTSQVALTAHLVAPAGHPGDAFLRAATQELHERFGIGHVTLQVVSEPFMPLCNDPAAKPPQRS